MAGFHTLVCNPPLDLPLRTGVLYLHDGGERSLGTMFDRSDSKACWLPLSLDARDKEDGLAVVLLRLCRRYGIHHLELLDEQHPQASLLRRLAALEGWGAEEWPRLG